MCGRPLKEPLERTGGRGKGGWQPATVGLVIPTGYSFNMDVTNIYLCMGAVFLAQATNTPMTWGQQLTLLCVAMLTSKGASGVTGSGFAHPGRHLAGGAGHPSGVHRPADGR